MLCIRYRSSVFDLFLKSLGIFFVLTLCAIILAFSENYFTSDNLASDILVQEVVSTGKLNLSNYVAQQTFWGFNILFWLPKYLIYTILPNAILTNKIYILLLFFLYLGILFKTANYLGNRRTAYISIAILGCGISNEWFFISVLEPAYVLHLVYMLLFIRLGIEMGKNNKNTVVFLLFIAYIISFDQRYAAIFTLPFVIAICIYIYIYIYKMDTFLKIWENISREIKIILGLVFSTMCGLAINLLFKTKFPYLARLTDLNFYTFGDAQNFFTSLAIHIQEILKLFGCNFDSSVSTISIHSVGYVLKLFCAICCLLIFPILCTKKFHNLSRKLKLLLIFYWVLIFELFYIYVLSSLSIIAPNGRYFVYEIPIGIMISSWYVSEYILKRYKVNKLLFCLFILLFGVISQVQIINVACNERITTYNNGISYKEKRNIIDVLKNNKLIYGYSTYWNAQILTSMSNVTIKILPIQTENGHIVPFYSLNYIDSFSADNYNGKTFVLLSTEEYSEWVVNNVLINEEIEPVEVIESNGYIILIFPYNIAQELEYFPYNESFYAP